MSATATVWLTDGYDRLPLPPRVVQFELHDGWVMKGTGRWYWPEDAAAATVAGAEIALHNATHTRGHHYLDGADVLRSGAPFVLNLAIDFRYFDSPSIEMPERVA